MGAKPRILKQPRLFEPPRGRRRNDAASTYHNRHSVLFLFFEESVFLCLCVCKSASVCGVATNVYLIFLFSSYSPVIGASFFSFPDARKQTFKAESERSTRATQCLMLSHQAWFSSGESNWHPRGSVITFDLQEGRTAPLPLEE